MERARQGSLATGFHLPPEVRRKISIARKKWFAENRNKHIEYKHTIGACIGAQGATSNLILLNVKKSLLKKDIYEIFLNALLKKTITIPKNSNIRKYFNVHYFKIKRLQKKFLQYISIKDWVESKFRKGLSPEQVYKELPTIVNSGLFQVPKRLSVGTPYLIIGRLRNVKQEMDKREKNKQVVKIILG